MSKRVDSWLVTDEFWQRVEPLIPQRALVPDKQYVRKPGAGRPAKPARQVFEAIVFVLRTGCQWRALPSDFPKWRTVHSYFAIWSEPREGGSLLEQALKKSGWRGPRETGAQRLQRVLDHRCAEREEHGHGGQQGL